MSNGRDISGCVSIGESQLCVAAVISDWQACIIITRTIHKPVVAGGRTPPFNMHHCSLSQQDCYFGVRLGSIRTPSSSTMQALQACCINNLYTVVVCYPRMLHLPWNTQQPPLAIAATSSLLALFMLQSEHVAVEHQVYDRCIGLTSLPSVCKTVASRLGVYQGL